MIGYAAHQMPTVLLQLPTIEDALRHQRLNSDNQASYYLVIVLYSFALPEAGADDTG